MNASTWLLVAAVGCGASTVARGSEIAGQLQERPGQKTVVILPVVDGTGGKWKSQSERMVTAASLKAREAFATRGFRVVDGEGALQAVRQAGIDLTDEEQQRRDSL
jgi:hypothetical protein